MSRVKSRWVFGSETWTWPVAVFKSRLLKFRNILSFYFNRATAACRSLAGDFVWKSLRVLDVRDEWRKDELRVVASLMKNLHVLTGVEKIHCFPTACVDKWQSICLRLGQQLRYLQVRCSFWVGHRLAAFRQSDLFLTLF
jgi:hypothetical protein